MLGERSIRAQESISTVLDDTPYQILGVSLRTVDFYGTWFISEQNFSVFHLLLSVQLDTKCGILLPTAREVRKMRGYYTSFGYYGLVGGSYRLFATEEDYREYMSEG